MGLVLPSGREGRNFYRRNKNILVLVGNSFSLLYNRNMFECSTKALILEKEPVGEYDGLLTLYTEDFGKVSVKAKSIRKITSKLSAHTEPGMLSSFRLIGKNPFQKVKGSFWLADGLGGRRVFSDFAFLDLVGSMTTEFHADRDLWKFLMRGRSDRKALFAILGFREEDMSAYEEQSVFEGGVV
jgi:hypothetical protein